MVSNGPGRINQAFSVRSSTWPKSQLRADWAYVEARYSHAYEITPDELAWLVDRVKHLHTIAAAICAEHLENDSGRES